MKRKIRIETLHYDNDIPITIVFDYEVFVDNYYQLASAIDYLTRRLRKQYGYRIEQVFSDVVNHDKSS